MGLFDGLKDTLNIITGGPIRDALSGHGGGSTSSADPNSMLSKMQKLYPNATAWNAPPPIPIGGGNVLGTLATQGGSPSYSEQLALANMFGGQGQSGGGAPPAMQGPGGGAAGSSFINQMLSQVMQNGQQAPTRTRPFQPQQQPQQPMTGGY